MLVNSIAIIVLAAAVVVNTLMIRRLQQDAQEPPPRREPRIEYTVTDAEKAWQMRKDLEARRDHGGGARG